MRVCRRPHIWNEACGWRSNEYPFRPRAARPIIRYAETPGRTLQGLRDHLRLSGVEHESWFPLWAMEYGTLTKSAIALLIYTAMLAAAEEERRG